MAEAAVFSADKDLSQVDWLAELRALPFGYGAPKVTGLIKQSPEHFMVTEIMDVEPSGEGEHYWLDITKTRLNTDAVAKTLARFCGVANRDIGYSGMKDFHAVTRQWFSVWKPKGGVIDWSKYSHQGVEIHRTVKHSRKIKRGTHTANYFQIRVVALTGEENVQDTLNSSLKRIRKSGVPNYFGAQRFGRGANNLPRALAMFSGSKKIKDRTLRGIFLSSARSWLFNQVVSARIKAGTWQSLYLGEPANLDGSNSVFLVTDLDAETKRLQSLDIHPTAPLWGEIKDNNGDAPTECGVSAELIVLESAALAPYEMLKKGLSDSRIEYQRRAIRLVPKEIQWSFDEGDLCLCFQLHKGQFATSVLRELMGEPL